MNRRAEDEPRFDEAWRAFVEDDARLQAPSDLEARVLNAVRTSQRLEPRDTRRQVIQVAALAATIVLTTTVLVWHLRRDPPPASAPTTHAQNAAVETPVRSVPRPTIADDAEPAPRVRPTRSVSRREPLPPVLMTLGASPVRDTEALQLVRLRLPREALQGLGVVLLEPDAGGVVDVDVLIGEDGLARDIRQVQTGGEHLDLPH